MKNRIVFFTDIPAPYRVEMYNRMHELDYKFEVWYMQKEVVTRPGWKFSNLILNHNFLINEGFYYRIYNFNLFLNLALIKKIIKAGDIDLILALSWNDLDVLILSFLKKFGIVKAKLHFWSEANYLTNGARNDNWLKKITRKFVYNHPDTIQISSGKMTQITLEKWGINVHKSVLLPNTIQENKYSLSYNLKKVRAANEIPIVFISARLIERLKGIINFLSSFSKKDFEKFKIILAGSGNDKGKIEEYISERGIDNHIILTGECDVNEMINLYARANIFCLPSFADPSPLSIIEALKMELPLLVSNRCGNHFEAVQNGLNGYTFDPDNKLEIRESLMRLLEQREKWEEMGDNSLSIYDSFFSKDLVINNFFSSFCTLSKKDI
ncbi:MAG: glycosyltransferase family 4 protein [Flavobacterium sp.]|uniref:glycosyltransferase family 4 protein n=1 Tax=Flavobacterium sp. TaxID=239 RepID=UPI003BBC3C7F